VTGVQTCALPISGVLLDAATCQEIVDRIEAALPRARALLRGQRRV